MSGDGFTYQSWLARHGGAVAKLANRDGSAPKSLSAKLISQTAAAFVIRLSLPSGDIALKAFNLRASGGAEAAKREISVLLTLRDADLAPRVIGYSFENGFVATSWVEGDDPASTLTTRNCTKIAGELGDWYRRFDQRIAAAPAATDWGSYLEQYEAFELGEAIAAHRAFLKTLPILERRIAKNDAALGNFVIEPGGRLIGLDFEAAALKPPGWDLLLCARVLAKAHPGAVDEIIRALLSAYDAPIGAVSLADFSALMKIFVANSAFKPLTSNRTRATRLMDAHNAAAPPSLKVEAVALTPMSTSTTAEIPQDVRDAFLSNLDLAVSGAAKVPSPTETPIETQSGVAALCATCQGKCCRQGAESHAFITPAHIRRMMDQSEDGGGQADWRSYFAEKIPERHIAGSCVYHSENGCVLDRRSRPSICNSFLCEAGRNFVRFYRDSDVPGGILIAAEDETGASRSAVFKDGKRTEL